MRSFEICPYGLLYTVSDWSHIESFTELDATENSDRVIQKDLEPAVRQKKCIRMADNMIVGGSTVAEAAENYELLLKLCGGAGLTFKASKTTICPLKVNILSKIWKVFSIPQNICNRPLEKFRPQLL